ERGGHGGRARAGRLTGYQRRQLAARADELAGRIEAAEARVAEIEAVFANPSYYAGASPGEVRRLEEERAGLVDRVAALMAEWEGVEGELGG
ncbi:MAG: ABC transporter C-terminal domain-containing protein, partial [Gemmatimonadota bacterium]|nr:ABC transporter C-terminal domain-containing protein [Gemmatimonadota bacterium]